MFKFLSLINKNFLLWCRGWGGTCCEQATPIVLALLLLWIYSLRSEETKPDTSYLERKATFYPVGPEAALPFPQNYAAVIQRLNRTGMQFMK